jgi:predicted phosphodiesterase
MLANEAGTSVNLRVVELDEHPNETLSHDMMVKDKEGNEYRLQIYNANDAYRGWKSGEWYEVRDYNLIDSTNPPYLQSTNRMQVKEVDGPVEEYTIAVIGDTHLGYKKRSNKLSKKRKIDCVQAFDAAISVITEDIRPDAVIQTGDILDDNAGSHEAQKFAEGVDRLNEFGAVYYVKGNHGNRTATSALNSQTSDADFEHLSSEGVHLDEGNRIMACGLDEGGSLRSLIDRPHPVADIEMGVFHENMKGEAGRPSIDDVHEEAGWDVYVVGHYHKASEFEHREVDTDSDESLTLYTGSIDGISKSKSSYSTWYDQDPSVWELKIRNGTIECIRHSLVPRLKEVR